MISYINDLCTFDKPSRLPCPKGGVRARNCRHWKIATTVYGAQEVKNDRGCALSILNILCFAQGQRSA